MRRNATAEVRLADHLILEEVLTEGLDPYAELFQKLRRVKPGSEKYHDLVVELGVAASVLAVKAKDAEKVGSYPKSVIGD